MRFGVKEYWIVNPMTRQVSIYLNGVDAVDVRHYNFDDIINAKIFEGLSITFDTMPI